MTVDLIELIRQKARERVPLRPPPRYFGQSRGEREALAKLDARLAELKRTGRPPRRGKS